MKTHNLKYLNFYTWYSSEGHVKQEMKREWCFGHIFRIHDFPEDKILKNIYTIRICHSGKDIMHGYSNQCYLSLTYIKRYLNQGKKIVNFTYTITKDKDYYYIVADVQDIHIAHKFILTYIRYLYEVPFALYLYEAVHLKHDCDEFKHLNYLTIYNIVSATIPNYEHGTGIHNIGNSYDFKKLLSVKDIKQCFNDPDLTQLNNIFPVLEDPDFQTLKIDFNDTIPWKFKKDRQQRIETYLHNYNILKKLSE